MTGQKLSRAEAWKKRLADAGDQLAMIETTKAIWYVCGIEKRDSAKMILSYLGKKRSGKKETIVVKRETIDVADIRKIKYYANV